MTLRLYVPGLQGPVTAETRGLAANNPWGRCWVRAARHSATPGQGQVGAGWAPPFPPRTPGKHHPGAGGLRMVGRGPSDQGTPKPTPRICQKEIRPWSNNGLGERIPTGFNRDSPSARKPQLQAAGSHPSSCGEPCRHRDSRGLLLWIHPSAPRHDVLSRPLTSSSLPLVEAELCQVQTQKPIFLLIQFVQRNFED